MSIIGFEIEEIKKICENVVPNSKIIACNEQIVRIDISSNEFHRQITVVCRFPKEYPKQVILIELKSKTLSSKFLDALASLAEKRVADSCGKPQILLVLRFIEQYLKENPLCICFDEIQQLRKELGKEAKSEQLKLKQKSTTVILTATGGKYFYKTSAYIPEEYPLKCVDLQQQETNLPNVLLRYLNGQSREIARQCVEPPLILLKDPKNAANFQPAPSLYKALKFCIEATRDFHNEICPICDAKVLPENPADVETNDSTDNFVERVYCGHLFHQGCLKLYLQEPPFPKGGKLCPAKQRHTRSDAKYYKGSGGSGSKQPTVGIDTGGECGIRLAHDRWVVNVKVAETRWAQKQARERELEEVVDFLK